MSTKPLNTPSRNPNEISIGSIKILLSTNNNTAKVIQSPEAKGDIIIETFVTHDSQVFFIQEIDDMAFCGAEIKSLSFKPDSHVKRIGNDAFKKSTIETISIPDSLEEFGERWCYGVKFLTNIIINPEHKFFQLTNGLLTSKDGQNILFAKRNLNGPLTLPSNITKILPSSFYSCEEITAIISNSSNIDYIGPYSFYHCKELTKIMLSPISKQGQNLTLGEKCFAFCEKLSNIAFPYDTLILEDLCFECCTSLSVLTFSNKKISIGKGSFSGCDSLYSLQFLSANNVEIKDHSFISLYKLKSIFLQSEQYKISENSFEDCKFLEKFYLKAQSEINSVMLRSFKSLHDIDLTSLTTLNIENYSFSCMNNLESVRLRSKNLCLKEQCFGNQEKISKIVIECENQMTFSHELFESCKALKSFKYTKSRYFNCSEKIDLAENCFANKENLEEVEIVAFEINLCNGCFKGSKKLQKVILHGKNITIGEDCFAGCDSLKSLIITELLKPVTSSSNFFQISKEIEFEVDDINLGKNCFSGLKNLQNVVLHGKNITIGENCFFECDLLKSLTVTKMNTNISLLDKSSDLKNLGEIEIEVNDINLGKSCFSSLKNLQNIVFHCKNMTFDENCFACCASLKTFIITDIDENSILNEIKLPESCLFKAEKLEEIEFTANKIDLGSSCFRGSKNLKKVTLHGKNITISESCFCECGLLKSFIVSKVGENLITESLNLEDQCFFNLEKLEAIEISSNNIYLHKNCFSGSKSLQKIILHGKTIVVGDNCFTGCDSLKSFIINETIEKIYFGNQCFSNLKKFEEINIRSTEIGFNSGCFNYSNKIKKVVLNCKTISIDKSCFSECGEIETFQITGLESNDIIDEINLMSECFLNSKGIKEIELKAKKIIVGDNCFKGATKLQKILIDGTIVEIGNNCFNDCNSLNSFTVNASLSLSIGSEQFIRCQNLNNINIDATKNTHQLNKNKFELNNDSFKGADNVKILEISGGNLTISNELLNCSSLTILNIKSADNVVIDSNTFNQSKLNQIHICSTSLTINTNCFNYKPNIFNPSKLNQIYICSTSLTINTNCFNNNTKLQNITFICPSIDIDSNCFNNISCRQLVFQNSNQLTFKSNVFCNVKNLNNIEFQTFEYINIGSNSFIGLDKLETIKFFSKKITIGNESFQNCSSLKSVKFIPKVIISYLNVAKSAAPKLEKIQNVFIGDKSFNFCTELVELNIDAIKEIHICKECFYNLPKLIIIKFNPSIAILEENCFYNCPGCSNITSINEPEEETINLKSVDIQNKINIKKNFKKKEIITPYKFENQFNSFFVLGIHRNTKDPSFISMFPSKPVTLSDKYIDDILTFCYPQDIKPIPSNNKSKILTGFVFYLGIKEFVGVALHIQIPPSSNSFVGNLYDRSYPFCICLVSDNPDIASHFTFLYDVVDSIIDKTSLPNNFDNLEIPKNIKIPEKGKCIKYLHDKPGSEYIALSTSAESMNFLLPKLFKYYENEDFKKYMQTDYLLYPTLQTLFTFLTPKNIVELFFCMICEKKIAFISDDLNKISFCVIALTNLLRRINVNYGNVIPCFPIKEDKAANRQEPYIFGYNKECDGDEIDVNLDKGTVFYNNDVVDLIKSFPYLQTLIKNANKLFNDNLNKIQIPNNNQKRSQFIQNADVSIYPDCFKYFAHTKYILNKYFIREFVRLIEKPFFPLLESFTRHFLAADTTDPNEPVAILNQAVFAFHIPKNCKKFMDTFSNTQIFIQIVEKLEKEHELSKIPSEICDITNENYFIFITDHPKLKKSWSCSSLHQKNFS